MPVMAAWLGLALLLATPGLLADVSSDPSMEYRPPVGGLLGGLGTTVYNFTAAPSAPEIFKRHFGGQNMTDAIRSGGSGQPNSGDLNKWYKYDQEIYRLYGKDPEVQEYIAAQKNLYTAMQTHENALWALVKGSKGAAGEMQMDNFYESTGWTKVVSQTGPHGIDGLYIKPGKNSAGDFQIMIAESKTGNSPLNNTKSGRQMSLTWIYDKLNKVINAAKADLEEARRSGDPVKVAEAETLLNNLQKIEDQIKRGKFRSTVHRSTIVQVNGRPVLRTELYKVQKGPSGAIDEVTIVPRLDKNGKPISFDTPLDSDDTVKQTRRQQDAYTSYFKGMQTNLTKMGVPEQSSAKLVKNLQDALKKGTLKPDANGSLDAAINRFILKQLRNDPDVTPEQVKQVRASQKRASSTQLNRLSHALSFGKAGAVGAISGGALAAMFELISTGRITAASARESALGGSLAVGNALAERGLAKAANFASKSKVIKRIVGRRVSQFIKSGKLVRAGGAMVVITSAAFAGYEYFQGNISGTQAVVLATEGVIVGFATIAVGAKLGAAAGSFIPIPGVGTAVGVVAGALVGAGYYVVKDVILGRREMAKQMEFQRVFTLIDDAAIQADRQEELVQLRAEADSFLDKAWKSLANSKSRF
jgi:hypothetical protein